MKMCKIFKIQIIIALIISFNSHAQFNGSPAVKVAKVQEMMMGPMRKIPGMIEAKHIATIKTESRGVVTELVEVGSKLKKGDIIAKLKDSQVRLKKEELNGAVKSAQAKVAFLRNENNRLTGLISKNLVSNSELDQNKSDLISARNDLVQAKSRYNQYLDQVKKMRVKAPYDGIVLQQLSQPGQLLNQGDEVVEFMQINNLEVIVNIPYKYKSQIIIGTVWQVETIDKTLINATVKNFIRAARGNSHTIEVHLSVTSLDLWSGEAVYVYVPMSKLKKVIAVPRDALVIRKNGIYVYTVIDNKSHKVDVVTGAAHSEMIAVTGKLSVGDLVIIRGNESLRPNQEVKIIE